MAGPSHQGRIQKAQSEVPRWLFFMAQRRMWHLMEQRMRDARGEEPKEKKHVVRECKTMEAEDSWLRLDQAKRQVLQIIEGDWRKPKV